MVSLGKKVNNKNWMVYVAQEMSNWGDRLEKDLVSEQEEEEEDFGERFCNDL